jgi:hypothetical protein
MQHEEQGSGWGSIAFPQLIGPSALEIIRKVCVLAGEPNFIEQARFASFDHGWSQASGENANREIFSWLISTFSYQGVSDAAARTYLEEHGSVDFHQIDAALHNPCSCLKLAGICSFTGCRYDKTSATCSEPDHIDGCPLPKHKLRNGRLNQTAYSLFLFIRDVAGGDLVAWIGKQLEQADQPNAPDRIERMQRALIEPLQQVYGISSKVISMTLADLLMGARGQHERWFLVGSHLIAVDTLVHNFLDRTGILQNLGAEHRYGPRCYREGGCASIIRSVSASIDAREFNPSYPANFPRFIQHAIWRFCAQDGLDLCNGNQIQAGERCGQAACPAFLKCVTADENLKK